MDDVEMNSAPGEDCNNDMNDAQGGNGDNQPARAGKKSEAHERPREEP